MKYIRTKCDVEIVITEFEKDLIVRSKDEKYYPNHRLSKKFVLKQSDTIEELCDEFVCKSSDYKKPYFIDTRYELPLLKLIKKGDIKSNRLPFELYGAIWTDKGLIYVAKMNEKGELELL